MAGELLGDPGVYGDDRVFVYIRPSDASNKDTEAKFEALEKAGHPVVCQVLRDSLSVGREAFLWELATALTGALLEINPFDQPDVQESKDNTKNLLEVYRNESKLPE